VPNRSSKKRPRDLNRLAVDIVADATDDHPASLQDTGGDKNPAAVELGRLGGKKGGPARAKKLTPERRRQIARKAAERRWHHT
jgi:hypothetical protein